MEQEAAFRGCYDDTIPRMNKSSVSYVNPGHYNWRTVTPATCTKLCVTRNYSYAVMRSGQACFCADTTRNLGANHTAESCDQPCDSSPEESCGGERLVSVYDAPLPLTEVQIKELHGIEVFPGFEPVNFTLTNPATRGQPDNQMITLDVHFGDDYPYRYEGPWKDGMIVQHTFSKPGLHPLQLTLTQALGPGSKSVYAVLVQMPIQGVSINCPHRSPAGSQSYSCDIAVAMGTGMLLSAHFEEDAVVDSFNVSDSQLDYIGVTDIKSSDANQSVLQSAPLPLEQRYIKANSPVLKDGLLVGFDLDVNISGTAFMEVLRPVANVSVLCQNNTRPAKPVLSFGTGHSCQGQGGYSFAKRACLNPTPDTTEPTLENNYKLVARLTLDLPSMGRQFFPLGHSVTVQKGDLLALVPETAVVSRLPSTSNVEVRTHGRRLGEEDVLEGDEGEVVAGEHQFRAVVVLPSRIWIRNRQAGVWSTSRVNVTLTNSLGQKLVSALAPSDQSPQGVEIKAPPYGLVGNLIFLEAIFESQADTYRWSLGPGKEALVNLCHLLQYSWAEPGLYNVSVEGENEYGTAVMTIPFLVTYNPPLPNITLNTSRSVDFPEYDIAPVAVGQTLEVNWTVYYEAPNVSYEITLGNASDVTVMVWEGSPDVTFPSAFVDGCQLSNIKFQHKEWGASIHLVSAAPCVLPIHVVSQNAFGNDTLSLVVHIIEPITEEPLVNITANVTLDSDADIITHGEVVLVDVEIPVGTEVTVRILVSGEDISDSCVRWLQTDRRAQCEISTLVLPPTDHQLVVEVSNPFSSPDPWNYNFTLQIAIVNLRVGVAETVGTDQDIPICLYAEQGSHVKYTLSVSDGTMAMNGTLDLLTPDPSCNTEFHKFALPGQYNVTAMVWNAVTDAKIWSSTIVQASVYTLVGSVDKLVTLNDSRAGFGNLQILYEGSAVKRPLEVKVGLAVTDISGNSTEHVFQISNDQSYPVEFSFLVLSPGTHYWECSVYNNVSNLTVTGKFDADIPIRSAVFSVQNLTVWSHATINFTIELLAGTNLKYWANFGDGSSPVNSGLTNNLMMTFNHVYEVCRTELFQVKLTVSNKLGNAKESFMLTVLPARFSVLNDCIFSLSSPPDVRVQVPFYVYGGKYFSAPLDGTYLVDFDDGVGERELSFVPQGSPSLNTASAFHLVTLWKTYSDPGTYQFTFQVNSSLFLQRCEVLVHIYEPIASPAVHIMYNERNVSDASLDVEALGEGRNYVPLAAMTVVHVLLARGSNVSYEWSFAEEGIFQVEPVSCAGDNARNFWKFKEPGEYHVSINTSNAVGWIEESVTVHVQSAVTELHIEGPGMQLANETLTFTLRMPTFPTDACIMMDFGDETSDTSHLAVYGEPSCPFMESGLFDLLLYRPFVMLNMTDLWEQNATTFQVYNKFRSTGAFIVRAVVQNTVSSQETYIRQVIRKAGCYPPRITFGQAGEHHLLVSQRLSIQAVVDINCTTSNTVYYVWWVTSLHEDGSTVVVPLPASVSVEGSTVSTLVIPAGTLGSGSYTVYVNVSTNNEPGIETVSSINVTYEGSPLVTVITGGDRRVISHGYKDPVTQEVTSLRYTIDGVSSYDPDRPEKTLNFTWQCRRKSFIQDNVTIEDIETFQVWNDDFSLLMNESIVNTDFSGEYDDIGGCFGRRGGPQDAPLPGGILSSSGGQVEIDTSYLYPFMEYEIKLVTMMGDKIGTDYQTIYVSDEFIPDVYLRCMSNCQEVLDPQTRLVIEAVDAGSIDIDINATIYYKWDIALCDNGTKQMLPLDTWQPFSSWANQTSNYSTIAHLYTNPGVFKAGSQYEVILMASYSFDFQTKTEIAMEFSTNHVPEGGVCEVFPQEGTAAQTLFGFECSGWQDSDGLPLEYTFQARPQGSSGTTRVSLSGRQDSFWPVYYSGVNSKSEFVLPSGSAEFNYTFDIRILVTDQYGTYAEVTDLSVNVYPFDVMSSDDLTLTLQDLTDAMVSEASTGHVDSATNYARAISDIINTETLSSSQASGNSSTIKLDTALKQEIREQLVTVLQPAASSSLSLEDVNQISTVLDLATAVPEEVSSNTQV
ncbi:uncharacterized protein [Diadema setosum]|uniref:uncharacterized protein n=1 Tax=Diadema setosum TaxID=31175 RepID=UPI003B3BBD23